MNLRLDHRQIRFRLSQDEVDVLQKTGSIEEGMPTAWLQPARFAAKADPSVSSLKLKSDAHSLTLCLPPALIETLATTKPSKEGITAHQVDDAGNRFDVILEIDVRKPR